MATFSRYMDRLLRARDAQYQSKRAACLHGAGRRPAGRGHAGGVLTEILDPAWPRRMLVEATDEATLVGIDHGFSFPLRYFEAYGQPLDWPAFLEDFQRHWPTDEDICVDFVRDGLRGNGHPAVVQYRSDERPSGGLGSCVIVNAGWY